MATQKLFAYSEEISVKPADSLQVMVSGEGTQSADVQLVRLVHGDAHPDGPGFVEVEVDHPVNGVHSVHRQYTQLGSHAVVDDGVELLEGTEPFTVATFVWPSLVGTGRQVLIGNFDLSSNCGWALGIGSSGHLEFWLGDGTDTDHVMAEVPLMERVWYLVVATCDPRRRKITLSQVAVVSSTNSVVSPAVPHDLDSVVVERTRRKVRRSGRPLVLAGCWDENAERGKHVKWLFNGKLDRPVIVDGCRAGEVAEALRSGDSPDGVIAFWDTSAGYSPSGASTDLLDVGPNGLTARSVNMPTRGMTGWNWDGRTECFLTAPEKYGGVLFAESSMTNCRWSPTIEFEVPQVRSGCYAIRLRAGSAEAYAPFFVRAKSPTAKVAFQVPTASYLAYANMLMAFDAQVAQSIVSHTPVLAPADVELYRNSQFGLSTYDHHADHLSGVCYSGWRRPIIDMNPKHRAAAIDTTWQFPADLSIVGWLEQTGIDYEVITDHDVHREGLELLKHYNVVITGTHPEYHSGDMLEATEDFMADGGRLMYLGANGYYWVTSFVGDGDVIEVRKLEGGTRAWQARPGEYHHMADGVRGGVWRNRGRGPQKVTGVGTTSEGMDISGPYRRQIDGYGAGVEWIFDAVDGELFGDFGLAHGGAAGMEIDRYARTLGTPGRTRLLASSEGLADGYLVMIEDLYVNLPNQSAVSNPRVRCDMTYATTDSGGASFCTGSIAWGQALPVDGYDNDVARITENVLRRFASDGPLPVLYDELDDADVAVVRSWRQKQDAVISALCDRTVLTNLEAAVFGPHSDVNLRILSHLRGDESGARWELVEEQPYARYVLSDHREGTTEVFSSAELAVHRFLLHRIAALEGEQ
ncbi:MAG: LamG domain-containing protein [Acidimicrobiia bacterium]|nr:LamG domain-containing protein [Actinomycetota bacterium]MBL6924593.1 LamG domain-containing protein [Acidimicrobiia bacterium]